MRLVLIAGGPDESFLTFSAGILVLIAVFAVVMVIHNYRARLREEEDRRIQEMLRERVISQSKRYHFLEELSEKFQANPMSPRFFYRVQVRTRAQVDQANADKYMMGIISERGSVIELIKQGRENEQTLARIGVWLDDLPPLTTINDPDEQGRRYMELERQMTEELKEEILPVVPSFQLTILYESPGGRSYHDRDIVYSLSDMIDLLRQMKKAEEHKSSARYQRGLVTESVRYNVMRRDGFRCVLCGRSAKDGVTLHVDHIIPVSKGGKSTMDNLRTLCEECNRGKRDKYNETGLN